MLNKAGIYVVDFIGNGQSSRALIRKGQLSHLVKTTSAGQVFTILDENQQQVKDARVWIAGHEYTADDSGQITVPFSTAPGRQAAVISAPVAGPRDAASTAAPSTYASLIFFNHEAESYQFQVGFYVDRESLLRGSKATVLVRPGLSINGTPVSLKLLEDVTFTITSTDQDGTSSTVTIDDVKLLEDREATHQFLVPPRLASIAFRLTAKITQATTGKKIDVADQNTFTLNGIDKTAKIEDLHLLRSAEQYVLEVRGRTGEPRPSRPVVLTFKHRDFRVTIETVLKSDADGRIQLGTLDGLESLTAKSPSDVVRNWTMRHDRHTYDQTVHGQVGKPIELPFMSSAAEASRDDLSLLQLSGDTFSVDQFEHLKLQDGLLVIEGLAAGDYDLLLKQSNTRIRLRIAAGKQLGSFIVGVVRQLETQPLAPLQIQSITPSQESLTVQLRNYSKFARVHVFASHYLPEYDAFGHLSKVGGAEPYMFRFLPRARSTSQGAILATNTVTSSIGNTPKSIRVTCWNAPRCC